MVGPSWRWHRRGADWGDGEEEGFVLDVIFEVPLVVESSGGSWKLGREMQMSSFVKKIVHYWKSFIIRQSCIQGIERWSKVAFFSLSVPASLFKFMFDG